MECDKCRNDAIFFQSYSGRHLCGRHLARDIETRAKHTLRSHRWLRPGDHILALVSSDRKSAALLYFLKTLIADRRDIRLSAVPACGKDTRMESRSDAVKIAESLQIPCTDLPLPVGSGTDDLEKVSKIALPTSLDDIVQGVLGEFLFGNTCRLVHPPSAGSLTLPVICPFIRVPSDELDLYWEIRGTGIDLPSCIPAWDTFPKETEAILEDYSRRHPATKYALLHLAEQISSGNAAATAVMRAVDPDSVEKKTSISQKSPNS